MKAAIASISKRFTLSCTLLLQLSGYCVYMLKYLEEIRVCMFLLVAYFSHVVVVFFFFLHACNA